MVDHQSLRYLTDPSLIREAMRLVLPTSVAEVAVSVTVEAADPDPTAVRVRFDPGEDAVSEGSLRIAHQVTVSGTTDII